MEISTLVFYAILVALASAVAIGEMGIFSVAEAKKGIHIPDELEDVIDDEEDVAWREWGKPKSPPEFDPPPDFSQMGPEQIQAEMMKRRVGPSMGFVKLRLGVPRSREEVPRIAMKWTNLLKSGSVDVKFMAVDTSTIMFNMGKAEDTEELKDFVLSQPEAYEFKVGDHAYRRPGDPPLEEVIEMLRKKKSETDGLELMEEPKDEIDEL